MIKLKCNMTNPEIQILRLIDITRLSNFLGPPCLSINRIKKWKYRIKTSIIFKQTVEKNNKQALTNKNLIFLFFIERKNYGVCVFTSILEYVRSEPLYVIGKTRKWKAAQSNQDHSIQLQYIMMHDRTTHWV